MKLYYSKRGRLRYYRDLIRMKLGLMRKFSKPDYGKVKRIVFVCKGNICRSAYAHAKMVDFDIPVTSFGLDTRSGDPADPRAQKFAAQRGVDLSAHVTRALADFEPQDGDLYVVMEYWQAKAIEREYKTVDRILLLGGLCSFPVVSDPYSGGDDFFLDILDILDECLNILSEKSMPV